jgi:hypothetical protein
MENLLNNTIYRYGYEPIGFKRWGLELHAVPPIYNPLNPNARRWFWTLYWKGKLVKYGLL